MCNATRKGAISMVAWESFVFWVPNAEAKCIRQRETYADRQVENEQFRLKYANEDELEALRAHARTQPP